MVMTYNLYMIQILQLVNTVQVWIPRPTKSKRIKWKVILNAGQDKLNKMDYLNELADGQVLVKGSLRALHVT